MLKKYQTLRTKSGFTLLEILLVIGIIAILAGIVIVAINPGRQLATVRNTERRSDLRAIESAMTQYYVDNFHYPTSTPTDLTEICDTGSLPYPSGVDCGSLFDLSALVPLYLTAIPVDPSGASSTLSLIPKAYAATGGTGYEVMKDTNGYIVLSAPEAELGTSIAIGTSTGGGGGGGLGISGLVAHWKMNDTNGTTVVDSKGGYTGTGTYTATSTGKIGGGVSFGGSDLIALSDPASLNFNGDTPFSVSLWIYQSSFVPDRNPTLIGNFSADHGYGWGFMGENGWISPATDDAIFLGIDSYYSNGNNMYVTTGHVRSAGVWQHIVATYDGSQAASGIHLYLNGAEQTTTTMMDGPLGSVSSGNPVEMGGDVGGHAFTGSLDDVRVYNKALTGPSTNCTDDPSNEVCEIWNGGAGTEAE